VCTGRGIAPTTVELPDRDRIANVPLNLVLLPLVEGERERVEFQFLLCRGEPRILDAHASVARRFEKAAGGRDIVEIEYEFDLTGVFAALARPFIPDIRLWFDASGRFPWVGHRMPLYPKGPTVLIVKEGFEPEELADDD
jgi:hypothetical protein